MRRRSRCRPGPTGMAESPRFASFTLNRESGASGGPAKKKTGHLSMAGDSFTCLSLCLPALTLSASTAAIGSGLGLVDLDLARAELFSVQRADGLTASIIVSDFDEPKSARPTGFTISDEIHFAHFAELAKQFANLILS